MHTDTKRQLRAFLTNNLPMTRNVDLDYADGSSRSGFITEIAGSWPPSVTLTEHQGEVYCVLDWEQLEKAVVTLHDGTTRPFE